MRGDRRRSSSKHCRLWPMTGGRAVPRFEYSGPGAAGLRRLRAPHGVGASGDNALNISIGADENEWKLHSNRPVRGSAAGNCGRYWWACRIPPCRGFGGGRGRTRRTSRRQDRSHRARSPRPELTVVTTTGVVPVRGATRVHERVRHRLIEHAVLSVPGVVRHGSIAPGRALPSIAIVDGARPTVNVKIAATWPTNGARVVDAVRAAVTQELHKSLGEEPAGINVDIARIESNRTPAEVADAYTAGASTPEETDTTSEVSSKYRGPHRIAGSTITGILIALGLVTAGVIVLRDAAINIGWASGSTWTAATTRWAQHAHWMWWTWPAAVVAGIVGLALLVLTVKPRRRTHIAVGDGILVPHASAHRWRDEYRGPLEENKEGTNQ